MKIAIDAGHNCKSDRGAMGVTVSEDSLTMDLAEKLIKLLEREGHQCSLVTPKVADSVIDSLQQRVAVANRDNSELYVSLHFNALNHAAYGSEIYAIGKEGKAIAERVLKEIVKLGFTNRGVKDRNFYVLKNTKMPAILVECCFCDSKRDMDRYDAVAMAIAIKNGILGKSSSYEGLTKKDYLKVTRLQTYLKPSTQPSSEIEEKLLIKLDQGIYSISDRDPVEEGHFWVELKSGLKGFIYQGHASIVSQ